jgi:hypothetical protein
VDTVGTGGGTAVRLHQEAAKLPAWATQASRHRTHGQGQCTLYSHVIKVHASAHMIKVTTLYSHINKVQTSGYIVKVSTLYSHIIKVQWSHGQGQYSVLTCKQGTDICTHGQGQYTL